MTNAATDIRPGDITRCRAVMQPVAEFAALSVRRHDFDRYLSCLFAPKAQRDAMLVLYAFNAEIARVRDMVHDPLPGEMRLQFWRDLLSGEDGVVPQNHPLGAAILAVVRAYRLPVPALLALIEARAFDLYDDPMPTWLDLEGYCGETASALIRLASLILAEGQEPGGAAECGHAGAAYALTGLLRAFPWHARRHQCYLPHEALIACGVSHDDIFAGRESDGLLAVLALTRQRARAHLAALRCDIACTEKCMAPAFYPVCLVESYLDAMEAADYRPYESVIDLPPLRKLWLIGRSAWRARNCTNLTPPPP